MATWKTLTREQKAAAEQLFDALATLDVLTDADAERASSASVAFSDLYAFATQPGRAMDESMRRALARDSRLREGLERILDKTAVYHFPRVAAASAGAVESRDGEGFTIRLRISRAENTQTYVMIEIADGRDETPNTLIVRGPDGDYGKYPLPAAQDGVIQILADTDSDLVQALRDVDTEVFIR